MSIRQYIGWVVLLLAWVPVTGAAETAVCDPWAAKIASVQGKVEAKRAKSDKWHATKLNEIFCAGDRIRVGAKGRAGIILSNETLVRLDQNTAITLTAVEKETPSLVEILKGIAHFISRVPRSLKVNTPFVNAAIEGTEFVVAVSGKQTQVTVFEGTVLTQNKQGEARITDGESVIARKGTAPSKTLLAKPRDTVQWALYFPPVIADGKGKLSSASKLLSAGRVNEAKKLLQGIDSGEAKALLSIVAVVSNDKDTAFKLATQATEKSPESAAAHIAMSYAWQAKLDLKQSLASAQQAIKGEPNNAIAWARLAELQLSVGELDEALASAKQATQLNDKLSRTQSILGYAHLVRIDIDNAIAAFDKAIELDQVDPLPHLGLGLAKIRKNDLKQGRREIEIAALLDPNNAIIRSYLGKAYFEEKRGPLDATQFAMAKALDPNDPTPYYYDAIRKQTENNPVGALADLNKSIELNDNRAVYRSSLQLDQDEASRSAGLARIYADLGFDQTARTEASRSLANDPANHSAHRFLADNYATRPRHEIAHVSELFQSQLLQPVGLNPVQPSAAEAGLNTALGFGASQIGFNEYSPLYVRNGTQTIATTGFGSNDLFTDEIIVSGLHDGFAYSFGQFSYNSNGFREDADENHDISDAFLQYEVTNGIDIQLEHRNRRTSKGDIRQSLEPDFSAQERRSLAEETSRIGMHFKISPQSDFLISHVKNKRNPSLDFTVSATTTILSDLTDDSKDYQLQYLYKADNFNLVAGAGSDVVNRDQNIKILFFGSTISDVTTTYEEKQDTFYAYSNYNPNKDTTITFGLSYDDISSQVLDLERNKINPKLGLLWNASKSLRVRLAAFETLKRILVNNQTLEPTQVAGFNQFFDEVNYTESTSYWAALDWDISPNLLTGVTLSKRDLDVPQSSGSPAVLSYQKQDEYNHSAFVNWSISTNWLLHFEYNYEEFNNDTKNLGNLKTTTIPVSLRYFHPSGFYSALKFSHVDQTGTYTDPSTVERKSDFNVADFAIGYRLPKQQGTFSLQINNIFNQRFSYQDRSPFNSDKFSINSEFVPEQTIIGRITINL